MYLLDTNVIIRALIGEEPSQSFFKKAVAEKELYLSVVVVGEFLSQATEKEEKQFQKLIDSFPILPIDLDTAKLAAAYRKKFLRTKRTQLLDYFLAAQAKLNHLTLVTNNTSDFPMKDIRTMTPSQY
ncbi:MAG: PIN domain-containing protein [Patescibacteria group bacterium]